MSRGLRVLLDARYIRRRQSGIGRYTEHLITELLALDPSLELRLIAHPDRPDPVPHPRVKARVFPAPANSPLTRPLVGRFASVWGGDLYHAPFNFLPAGLGAIPSTFTLHDTMWIDDPSLCTPNPLRRAAEGAYYAHLISASVAEASRIMTVSRHSKRAIERRFPQAAGRVDVTPNGVDAAFRPMDEAEAWRRVGRWVQPRRPFVLIVGQGAPYKNHAAAVAAFRVATERDPHTKLVLVRRITRRGDAVGGLLDDPALSGRVVALDYVSLDELRALYSVTSCFLFPSLEEGFGLPALEAMACGAPVITSDRGAPAEVCGRAARLVDPSSIGQIAAAIAELLGDRRARDELSALGLERAARFNWRRSAERVRQSYDAIAQGR